MLSLKNIKPIFFGVITLNEQGNIEGDFRPENVNYDKEFPEHPLSRTRRHMKLFEETIEFDDAMRDLPRLDFFEEL